MSRIAIGHCYYFDLGDNEKYLLVIAIKDIKFSYTIIVWVKYNLLLKVGNLLKIDYGSFILLCTIKEISMIFFCRIRYYRLHLINDKMKHKLEILQSYDL